MEPEVATETIEAVRFGFMTDEEARKLSFKKITNNRLIDALGNPEPGGLYDPALGPTDDTQACKSCGQRVFNCNGHCGHIDLVSVVYHPLLFNMLFSLLERTCFFCFRFRAPREEVKLCIAKLNLIVEGDIAGARNLNPESDSCWSAGINKCTKNVDGRNWTSLQLTEALSVLNSFLKVKKKKCMNESCKAKNPAISKPTFGWIHMKGLSAEHVKANIINGRKLGGPMTSGDDKSASDVENPYDEDNGVVVSPSGKTPSEKPKTKPEWHTDFMAQTKSRPLLPSEVKGIFELLWKNEADLCSFVCDIQQQGLSASQKDAGYFMFFLKTVLVPPTKFRPPLRSHGTVSEHPQTVLLGKVLEANIALGNAYERKAEHSKIIQSWMDLQQSVNVLFDSKAAGGKEASSGICQLLEKKEGMFRQKMLGKRVNFACRSVISPDPYLAVNEIGIPPVFALKLTYPERVTPWNVKSLQHAVVNGTDTHPGATHILDKLNLTKIPSSKRQRVVAARKLPSSRGAAAQPGKSFSNDTGGKIVMRHMRNGDIVLVNRQPTLHKPSIIALKVRVLPGERTIRFHYANCDSFNADFDGDEINVHFPQDDISRAEAYNIVNADNQYIVPTRGDPKRALIQDHIVSAVVLTKRDTFLTWEQFNELLYASGVCSYGASSSNTKAGRKICLVDSEDIILAHPPAIIRPQRLWTGKQVITAILNHITKGSLPFTCKKRAKIAREYFGTDESKMKRAESSKIQVSEKKMKGNRISNKGGKLKSGSAYSLDEDIVFICKNELVQGVIDKEQFGMYGLVHTVQEMYGVNSAGNLLSVLSRVLTSFLQMHGFTCGLDDLLLIQSYENQRKKLLDICLNSGEEVHKQFIGCDKETLDFAEMQVEIEKAIRRNGDSAVALLDGMMQSKLNTLNSAVTKLFPEGLKKPFRKNCLSLMTLSGAKGGTFNFQQISLLLGQQALEGKRVPRMVSGKTLPCFPAWDSSARAGGFISDRYLTGLRPQEFYFHCMAGREGLVDTAVKTSRSGYLQRCLIKNLECLKVHYDYTVRDADGSIIQFRYGEDGVDVHQKNYLAEFEALAVNQQLIVSKNPLSQLDDACVSEYIELDNELPNDYAKRAKDFINNDVNAQNCGIKNKKDRKSFVKLVKSKYFRSLAQPGEPVGVIAAQSVGEPSTQMTLNTFHHAGRGEMNVTLGIPRLQEILMTASANIKTPTMTCPLFKTKSKDDAERLSAKLNRVTVADLIEKMEVSVVPFDVAENAISSIYKLKIKLYEPELYPPHTDITLEECEEILEDNFLRELEDAIHNHLILLSRMSGISSATEQLASDEMVEDESRKKSEDDDDDDDDDGGTEGADDLGSDARRSKQQASDERDYDEDTEGGEEDRQVGEDDEDDDEDKKDKGNEDGDKDNEDEDGDEDNEDEDKGNEHGDEDNEDKNENVEQDVASSPQKPKPSDKKKRLNAKQPRDSKKKRRSIFVATNGSHFEVHFKLQNEPHILLSQIVEKVAKKVYVKSAGAIEQCKVVEVHLGDSSTGGIPMLRKGKDTRPALQTAGVDFSAFWDMQDELDITRISSNDVNAMLVTYGVEAARATIITEIFTVFNHYGVSVDMRHLSLIADFMTHTGSYRSLSRNGGIAQSISPLAKMSYESASKFLVKAASTMEVDYLESPSSRICLGLPAKVGTGCFDLLQSIDV